MKKRIFHIFLFILVVVFTSDLFRAYSHLSERRIFMKKAQDKYEELKSQQENLKRKLAGTQTADFLDKQAREKLNMGKTGEVVVLLPTIIPPSKPTPTPVYENWEKWVKIFY